MTDDTTVLVGQLTIDDMPPTGITHTRGTDPTTSHEAAIALQDRIGADMQLVLDAIRYRPQATATELGYVLLLPRFGIEPHKAFGMVDKRISDLASRGLIEEVRVRPCQHTKRNARTWKSVS